MKRVKIPTKSRFKKWSKSEKIVLTIITVVFSVYALTLMYPFFFMIANSLRTPDGMSKVEYGLPKVFVWSNYKTAVEWAYNDEIGIAKMFINSAWQTVLATTLGMIASSCMAYVTAKYDFKFLKVLYAVGIFAMVVPIIGSTPAMYKLLSQLGIRDNPFLIGVIWFNGFGFSFMVLYSFFKSVSWSYAEAAFIDGASHFQTFIKVMLPQAMPAVWSMLIISAIGFWNDYMTDLLYLPSYPNVALGLYNIKKVAEYQIPGGLPVYYAMMLLTLIPIIVVFIAFQKTIMSNISTGGLKG